MTTNTNHGEQPWPQTHIPRYMLVVLALRAELRPIWTADLARKMGERWPWDVPTLQSDIYALAKAGVIRRCKGPGKRMLSAISGFGSCATKDEISRALRASKGLLGTKQPTTNARKDREGV